jgi:hypothetical protein
MKLVLKAAALLLVAAVATIFVTMFVSAQAARPSGCHEHGNKAPAPNSYHCCVAGHNAAQLQVRFRLGGLTEAAVVELMTEPSLIATSDAASSFHWAPGFSPGIAPIRI